MSFTEIPIPNKTRVWKLDHSSAGEIISSQYIWGPNGGIKYKILWDDFPIGRGLTFGIDFVLQPPREIKETFPKTVFMKCTCKKKMTHKQPGHEQECIFG